MLRLLVNAAFDANLSVGIARYLRCVIPQLARLCDVTVLTPSPEFFTNTCEATRIPNWTSRNVGRLLWTLTLIHRHCTREYDALLCPTPVVPVGVRIPALAVVHDLTPLVMNQFHSPKVKAVFWLGLHTLRWADAVVCVSESTRRDLLGRDIVAPGRIRVVPNGPGFSTSTRSDRHAGPDSVAVRLQPYVLYVGGHAPHKNVPRLIAAFARLRVKQDIRLVLVGAGDSKETAATTEAIRRHRVADRISLLRNLSDDQLSSLYRGCTAFVYPSLYEGFGLPVLEAMAHGAPVACSSTSSIPEIAGDAGLLFNPLSVAEIAEKLHRLCEDAELASRLRVSGSARARKYSWAQTARGIYEAAVAVRGRPTRNAGAS